MPFNIPVSLFAIVIGTVLAFTLGYQSPNQISEGLSNVGLYPILPSLAAFDGMTMLFTAMVGLLAVIIPITVYNSIETMNNVDAMDAAGDGYDVRKCQAVDGVGTMLGSVFGGLFPTTVYIASVGSKEMGAGRGYSILNAVVFGLAAVTGVVAALSAIIPMAAIAPILVFVGLSLVGKAFQSNETKYYPAVALAMLPYFANYVMTRFNSDAGQVVSGISEGIVPLGEGAMFTAIILGAVTVFIIDGRFVKAAAFSLVAAGLSFTGFMHASEMAFNAATQYAVAYLLIAVFFVYCAYKEQSSTIDVPEHRPLKERTAS